jgi:hypothetical protein
MATPLVLDDYGRPVDWTVASTVEEDWGTWKVYCGTTDVTEFRGVRTVIREHTFVEPFAYGPAVIAFPQISPYDTLGAGDLDWFVQGMNVTLKKLDPDGVTETNAWEGIAASWDPEHAADGYVMVVQCMGALFQASLEPMPPDFDTDRIDVGLAIKQALDGLPARRYAALPTVVTTIGTRNRGAWNSRLDHVQEILSTAYNADGTRQWTVGCNPGRFPTLHQKDLTSVHWHVAVGTPGATLRERSDITSSVNVIFGEGIAPDGGRWRNTRYPTAADPVFVPLASVSQNMPYTYDGEGNATVNPSFDPARLRVARYENFGAGVEKSDGVDSARGELTRDVNPGWFGTLTLTIDPEEGSRLDMRAGQNIALRHHHGDPTRLFHIAQVHVDDLTGAVTLTIDTNARDAITLVALHARNKDAATDPARRLSPPRRRSRQTPDSTAVFDAESGAGLIPATSCAADAWTIIRIPASRYGTIARTVMTAASAASSFAVGVFSKAVTAGTLNSLVGNPISGTGWDVNADSLSAAGLLMAWGDTLELAGYWPLSGDGTHPVTGRLIDDGSWDFISDTPPWLWVAVFPDVACTFSGRLYLAPEQ